MTQTTTMRDMLAAKGLSDAQIEVALDALARNPFGTKARKTRTPKACACGCAGMTKGGTWLPGHDAKHLSRVMAETRELIAGGRALTA